MSKQAREEQYAPIKMDKGKIRTNRSPKMSDGAGKDPVSGNNRGNQGRG
jgi:hypothetical protein